MNLRIALPPRITDGETWCICATKDALWDTLQTYIRDHGKPDEKITITLRELTPAQIEALPEI